MRGPPTAEEEDDEVVDWMGGSGALGGHGEHDGRVAVEEG